MSKEILIQKQGEVIFAAIVQNNNLSHLLFESPAHRSMVWNIYLGRILERSSDGIRVDIGGGFQGIVSTLSDTSNGKNEILVQVTAPPNSSNNILLTTDILLKGYAVTYTPFHRQDNATIRVGPKNQYIQVSEIIKGIKIDPLGGFSFCTDERNKEKNELNHEAKFIHQLWQRIEKISKASTAPLLIYQEGDLLYTVIRDFCTDQVERVIVEGEDQFRMVRNIVKILVGSKKPVVNYKGSVSLFDSKGILDEAKQIYETTRTKGAQL